MNKKENLGALGALAFSYGQSDSNSSSSSETEDNSDEEDTSHNNMEISEDTITKEKEPKITKNTPQNLFLIESCEKIPEVIDLSNENLPASSFEGTSYQNIQIKKEKEDDCNSVSVISSGDEDNTEDSESDSSSSLSGDEDDEAKLQKKKEKLSKRKIKAKGEFDYDDLPPIEDLHISVPHENCQPFGIIKSVVEPLVIVESFALLPALNIDTILFLDNGDRALGQVFDVFGPVKQPFYSVRFNSKDHIVTKGIEVGMTVFCAPSTPHTRYVLMGQLNQMRGTDASWKDDIEPPAEEEEYSDDEKERISRRRRKKQGISNTEINEEEKPESQNQNQQTHQPRKQRFRKGRRQGQSGQNQSQTQTQRFPHQNAQNQFRSPMPPPLLPGFNYPSHFPPMSSTPYNIPQFPPRNPYELFQFHPYFMRPPFAPFSFPPIPPEAIKSEPANKDQKKK